MLYVVWLLLRQTWYLVLPLLMLWGLLGLLLVLLMLLLMLVLLLMVLVVVLHPAGRS